MTPVAGRFDYQRHPYWHHFVAFGQSRRSFVAYSLFIVGPSLDFAFTIDSEVDFEHRLNHSPACFDHPDFIQTFHFSYCS